MDGKNGSDYGEVLQGGMRGLRCPGRRQGLYGHGGVPRREQGGGRGPAPTGDATARQPGGSVRVHAQLLSEAQRYTEGRGHLTVEIERSRYEVSGWLVPGLRQDRGGQAG